jgi:hypothetical protein
MTVISRQFAGFCQRVKTSRRRNTAVTRTLSIEAKHGCDMAKKRKARGSPARQPRARQSARRWSARVTRESDALDLDRGVFSRKDPKSIARSLKRSAERSSRRKTGPYRSALSMLTFYINRGGKNLSASRKKVLEKAKDELRKQFNRT